MLPIDPNKGRLLQACLQAHRNSCARPNISSEVLKAAFQGSGRYTAAVAAALSALGGAHAPIEWTVWFLQAPSPTLEAERLLNAGQRVPGWGNSFVKGTRDPLWLGLDRLLADAEPALYQILEAVTRTLHERGKMIYPNPSAYTAAVAIALKIPAPLAPWLLVAGRLDGWTDIIHRGLEGKWV